MNTSVPTPKRRMAIGRWLGIALAWPVAALAGTTAPIDDRALPEPNEARLTLNLRSAPVTAVLRAYADLVGANVAIGEGVNGRVTLRARQMPANQVLDFLLDTQHLATRTFGNVMWIVPRDELAVRDKRKFEAAQQAGDLIPLASRGFQLNYQKAVELRKILIGEAGHRLLSKRGSVAADARTNQLFVADVPDKLTEVADLIERIDVPVRQVLIEARIVEADDRFSRNLGVKLGFARPSAPGETLPAGNSAFQAGSGGPVPNHHFLDLPATGINGFVAPSLAITLFGRAAHRLLQLELSALEADGNGKIISSPRVVTADKVQAVIEQGTELPYQVSAGNGITTIQFRQAKLRLEVTPQITPEGQVVMNVDVNKDSVGQQTANGYAIDTKHVRTQVLVENGGTVAIGGIYQEEERKTVTQVPVLGDLPVLGALFRNQADVRNRRELLVFITPRIVEQAPVSEAREAVPPGGSQGVQNPV